MEKKEQWELLRNAIRNGGDLEWNDEAGPEGGRMYRGPIKSHSVTEGGARVHIVFARCAFQPPNGNWHETHEQSQLSISLGKFTSAEEGRNGQIDFVTEHLKGTYFPQGQNLSWSKVKRSTN